MFTSHFLKQSHLSHSPSLPSDRQVLLLYLCLSVYLSLSYLSAQLLHFTILRTAPMRKNIRMGSSRIYWDRVIQPVSGKRCTMRSPGLQFHSESKIAGSEFPQCSQDEGNRGNFRSRSEHLNFYQCNQWKKEHLYKAQAAQRHLQNTTWEVLLTYSDGECCR